MKIRGNLNVVQRSQEGRGGDGGGGGVNRGFTISNLATIVSSVGNLQLHNDF